MKKHGGITLIALVITIIVLLILAMVTVKILINQGIIRHAQTAVNDYDERQAREGILLAYNEWRMDQYNGSTTSLYDFFKARYGDDNVTDNGDGSINVKVTTNAATYTYRLEDNGTLSLLSSEQTIGGNGGTEPTNPTEETPTETPAATTFYGFLYDTDSDGTGDEIVIQASETADATKTLIKAYGSSFSGPASAEASGIKTVTIKDKIAPTSMAYWFNNETNLTTVNGIEKIDTSNVTSMRSTFSMCTSLQNLDVSHFNTSNVTDMARMFNGAHDLKNIDVSGWDTSNVTNMECMFNDCESFTDMDFSHFDTRKVTNMRAMFGSCFRMDHIDIRSFDTSNVTNMEAMFFYCSSMQDFLADRTKFNTAKVSNMSIMFVHCTRLTSLDLSFFNTSSLTRMGTPASSYVFWRDGSKVEAKGMFNLCSKLENLNISSFDTSKIDDFSEMFRDCPKLTTIQVGDGWVIDEGDTTTDMFTNCGTNTVTRINQ